MLKKRNRVYRRIAVALTVALLAGQSHAFVLAEEGDAPQTEITEAVDTISPDNGDETGGGSTENGENGFVQGGAANGNTENNGNGNAQGGNTENNNGNSGADNQSPEENENTGDQQGDGDEQDKCICGTKCAEGAVNTECPVCASDYAACVGQEKDNDPENGGQENIEGIIGGQECVCETVCTEEAVNAECPVCAADYANCVQNAGEGVDPAGEEGLEDEEGIATLADEGVEARVVSHWFEYGGLRYKVTKDDGDTKEVEVVPQVIGDTSAIVTIPTLVEDEGIQYRVTGIGSGAFSMTGITSITIPDSVEYIGMSAFAECGSLSSITIPGSVKSIGREAFRKCSLNSVTIQEGVTKIEKLVFFECQNLTNVVIPNGVTSIEESAFCNCVRLKSVTIPEGVTSIGQDAFSNCIRLESVTIPNGTKSIETSAFGGCTSLRSVTIPNSVTSIKFGAFRECSSLSSVTIPEGVTSIGNNAFMKCTSLKSITIPGSVEKIGGYAFFVCSSLTNITIPDGVTSIEEGTFSNCSSLTDITIPNSVTSIGGYAFNKCGSLTSITIPNGVTSIAAKAFYDCKKLETLQIAISSGEKYQFPTVGADAFTGLPNSTDRNNIIVKKGDGISDDDLKAADVESAFIEAAKNDGDSDNSTWYGWPYIEVPDVKDTHKVTINVQKDNDPWTDHGRTFALTKDGTTFVTDLNAVEAGTYTIYDITGLTAAEYETKGNTGVTVTVADADVSATVDYYTVTFYYVGDDGNEHTYGDGTAWEPQIILKDVGRVTEPATNPTKPDHTFDKWVTTKDGDDAFNFAATPITATGTKIYAKWTEDIPTTYYTVTFYDGTTAYGADTLQSPQSVASGQKADKPADPEKPDWQFAGWKTTDGGTAAYDFDTPVTGNTNIYASWVPETAEKKLHITATATDGGTISPEGDREVTEGGEVTFEITPDEGNRIKAVTVDADTADEKDVTAELRDTQARAQTGTKYYTFSNVTKDHTIHAEFEKDGNGGGGGGDNPDPNPNPNPNPDPGGGDNSGGGSGGGGNTNPGGGNNQNPDGGNNGGGNNNGGNAGNGGGGTTPGGSNSTVNGQITAGTQAGSGAAGTSAGGNATSGGSAAGTTADGTASATSEQTAGGTGTTANGKEPKTGDASYLQVYATLAMIAGLTYLLLYVLEESRGMSEREKEAFVAAFIRWGKKGGAFRKGCAVIAIFCLLAYYHIIGKNVGGNALREKHLGQAF